MVSKKTEKLIKPRKPEKNNRKNQTVKKNQLELKKKKPTSSIRFQFYKPESRKNWTEPNSNRAEPNQNK